MSLGAPLSHIEGQESKAAAFSRHPPFQLSPRSLNREECISSVCVRWWRRPVKGNGNRRGQSELLLRSRVVSDWVGKRTGLHAGRKESHFVIRCLLFSLLIPFRVSWDEKHQQIASGSWRVSLTLLPFCCGASFLSKPGAPFTVLSLGHC